MEKSIEQIWKEGFINEKALIAPKLNDIYNQRSHNLIDKLIRKMEFEVKLLIPMSIFVGIINTFIAEHIVWGILSFIPFIPFFIMGRKQLKSVRNLDYNLNCYEYLKSVDQKFKSILRFNEKMTVIVVAIFLFPMLLYTYFNQQDKTFGEIFGASEIGGSNLLIFLILPVILFISWGIFRIASKVIYKERVKMQVLIEDMEALQKELG
jgi:hypothetical protein